MIAVRNNSFLQIWYGNYHRVTISRTEIGEVSFYDCLSNGNISQKSLHQIGNII